MIEGERPDTSLARAYPAMCLDKAMQLSKRLRDNRRWKLWYEGHSDKTNASIVWTDGPLAGKTIMPLGPGTFRAWDNITLTLIQDLRRADAPELATHVIQAFQQEG
jgi:hypothetical protein